MKPVRVFVRVGRCWVNAASSRPVEARLIRSTDHLGHPRHCLGSTGDLRHSFHCLVNQHVRQRWQRSLVGATIQPAYFIRVHRYWQCKA